MKRLSILLIVLGSLLITGCQEQDFAVTVDKPLRVLSISPADNSGNVPLNSAVSVIFSEDVTHESISNSEFFYLENITDPANPVKVDGAITYTTETKTAMFTPSSPLSYSSTYRVMLTQGLTKTDQDNSFGGTLAIAVSSQFTTVDPDHLQLVYSHPAASAWDVETFKPITLIFSHEVDPASVVYGETFTVNDITDSANPVTIQPAAENGIVWDEAHQKLVFTPATFYGYSRLLQIELTSGVKTPVATLKSGYLLKPITLPFKTVNPPEMRVIATHPGNGNEQVKRETAVDSNTATSFTITLSEGVKQSEIDTNGDGTIDENDTGALMVQNITGDTPSTIPCSVEFLNQAGEAAADAPAETTDIAAYMVGSDITIRLTPTAPLNYSTLVQITLKGDENPAQFPTTGVIASDRVTDKGGQLPNTVQYSFRIEDPVLLGIVSLTTGSGMKPLRHAVDGNPDTFSVTFTEGVLQSSLSLGTNIVVEDVTGLADPMADAAHGTIDGTLSFNEADAAPTSSLIGIDNMVTFTPTALLPYGTKIRVTLVGHAAPDMTGILSDRATDRGGQLPETKIYLLDVETLPDLYITGTAPGNSESGKLINGSITINFSEGINCSSAVIGNSITLTYSDSDPVAPGIAIAATIAPDCTDGDTSITVVPDTDIKYSRDITVTLSDQLASLRSLENNPNYDPLQGHLRGGYTFSYVTEDPRPLFLTNAISDSGQFIIPRDDQLLFGFSEGIAQSSVVLGSTIIVEDVTGLADPKTATAHGEISGNLSFNDSDAPDPTTLIGTDNIVTFTPDQPLPYGTLIRITIPGSANPADTVIKSDRATPRAGQLIDNYTFLFQVIRLEELYVLNTSPGHNSRTVPNTTNTIIVTFSEAPDCATITNANLAVTYDNGTFEDDSIDTTGATIAGNWSCTNGDNRVTFTATEPFGYGRDILVSISSDVRDANSANINLNDPTQGYLIPAYQFGFGTEHMRVLQILATNAGGSSSFDVDSNITVVFDRPVDCGTITATNFFINPGNTTDDPNKLTNAAVICNGAESNTIELDPVDESGCGTGGLCFDTIYTFTLMGSSTGICVPNKDSNDLSDDGCIKSPSVTYTFKTQALPEFVANLTPEHNTTAIPVGIQPQITFSASINTASVTTDIGGNTDGTTPNICLVEGKNVTDCTSPDVVSVTYSYTGGDTVVTLIPDATLTPDTDYTLVVSRDVEDLDARKLSGFYTSTFRTTPGGLLSHVIVNNGESIDNLTVEAFFNRDVDVTTIKQTTFYMTYLNEFGGMVYLPGALSFNAGCDQGTGADCTSVTFTPDFSMLFACNTEIGSPQYALPMNAQFTLHMATLITSNDGTLHVPTTTGQQEFLYQFTTPTDTMITSVDYGNGVVGPTALNHADEVPVNSQFTIQFDRTPDPLTINKDTIFIEEDRNGDGSMLTGGDTFTVNTPGTFVASRDEGKYIDIHAGDDTGRYKIVTVVDDQNVTLNGASFIADHTNVYWQKLVDLDKLSYDLDGDTLTVSYDGLLNYSTNYHGYHASVSAGGSIISFPIDEEIFRVRSGRDLGKNILITRSASGNESMHRIVAVDEVNNRLTVDGTFTATEQNLSWRMMNNGEYQRLVVKGRTPGTATYIKDLDGNPVIGTGYYRFTTSPETIVAFTPPGTPLEDGTIHQLQNIAVIFSRDMKLDTLVQSNLYTIQNNKSRPGLISYIAERANTALLMPVPALEKGFTVSVAINKGVLDFRGNPVVPVTKLLGSVTSSPSSNAVSPSTLYDLNAGSIIPGSGAIKGDQLLTITFGSSGSNDEHELTPSSINSDSLKLLQVEDSGNDGVVNIVVATNIFTVTTPNTFIQDYVGYYINITGSISSDGRYKIVAVNGDQSVTLDHTFTASESNLDWELEKPVMYQVLFVPGGQNGDVIDIKPKEHLDSGKEIKVAIDATKISNLYTFAPDGEIEYQYTVETTAPVLSDVMATTETHTEESLTATTRTDIKPDTELVMIFDEVLDGATISQIRLTDQGGSTIGYTTTQYDNAVILKPDTPLSSLGNPYTLTIDNITDTAGNSIAAPEVITFSIETTAPLVLGVTPADTTAGVSIDSTIDIQFNEPINIASLYGSTTATTGTFTLTYDQPLACNADTFDQQFGCIALSGDQQYATLFPKDGNTLLDETTFTIDVAASIADLAGNTLGVAEQYTFDTIGGDAGAPQPLCALLPQAVNDDTIEIYYTRAIDPASITDTFTLYDIATGEAVPGTLEVDAGDGTILRFITSAPLPAGDYGVTVSTDLTDLSGTSPETSYHLFFQLN